MHPYVRRRKRREAAKAEGRGESEMTSPGDVWACDGQADDGHLSLRGLEDGPAHSGRSVDGADAISPMAPPVDRRGSTDGQLTMGVRRRGSPALMRQILAISGQGDARLCEWDFVRT
jgi:hypothetical protein